MGWIEDETYHGMEAVGMTVYGVPNLAWFNESERRSRVIMAQARELMGEDIDANTAAELGRLFADMRDWYGDSYHPA